MNSQRDGGDTTLSGAVVKATSVIAKVGGSLRIVSLQNTSTYNSENQSQGGSMSIDYPGEFSALVSHTVFIDEGVR